MSMSQPEYECPVCGEWIETPEHYQGDYKVRCPSCGEKLVLSVDAEFENGSWHDLSKLVTAGSHWDDKV